MKVILMEDVLRLGSLGDVVTVKDGYGRNYLIPQGKALAATAGNMAKLKATVRLKDMQVKKDTQQAEQMAEQLSGVSCTVRVKADESDQLYGSVGPREIVTALGEQGIAMDVSSVLMEEHIKMLGVFPVSLHLFKGVDAEIKVWVIRE
ncbi:50S ribosomal protein L9 [bacterium]|nr:50S ribosomal protein L9 [bacterium]